jgi:hypothetical protein
MSKNMDKIVITPYNVVDNTELPEMSVDQLPVDGDALEICGETYYVCQFVQTADSPVIGVIPLVVRNPSRVLNIKNYIDCLSIAHRRVLYKNANGICDMDNCDEMIIT